MSEACAEMPRYRCHKQVWALKISRVLSEGGVDGGYALLEVEEPGYAPIRVDPEYMKRHNPTAGGYYVVYEDGYKSFSPAEAFESGYTRL